MMEPIAQLIEAALDREEMEPEEVSELTIDLPDSAGFATVRIGNKDIYIWDALTRPYAYHSEIAHEMEAAK